MPSEDTEPIQLLQGTLDLIVLRTLATMGPRHAYQIATRLQQISDRLLNLNQGTLYPALVRLEQYGWIKGTWGDKRKIIGKPNSTRSRSRDGRPSMKKRCVGEKWLVW
jgi:DNA-binding PadR family transcriptional regulator